MTYFEQILVYLEDLFTKIGVSRFRHELNEFELDKLEAECFSNPPAVFVSLSADVSKKANFDLTYGTADEIFYFKHTRTITTSITIYAKRNILEIVDEFEKNLTNFTHTEELGCEFKYNNISKDYGDNLSNERHVSKCVIQIDFIFPVFKQG